MRVILIDPNGIQKGINVGLAYLAGALKRNKIETKVMDLNNYWMSFNKIIEFIKDFTPQIIGYSIKTSTYFTAINLLKEIRKFFPNILSVVGGAHITLTHQSFIRENPYIDFLISGEGEETFTEFCSSISNHRGISNIRGISYYDSGRIVSKPPEYVKNLDNIPFPDFKSFNFIDFKRFPYPLVTSRGCPYKCIYCAVPKISGSL